MPLRLKDKRILITGGNRGIGKAIAEACLREGGRLVITYHSGTAEAQQLHSAAQKNQQELHAYKVDLRDSNTIPALIDFTVQQLGGIDVLVNNAGIVLRKPLLETRPGDYQQLMSLNLQAPYFMLQAVAKQMIAQGGGGSIINVSSINDRLASPNVSLYQCSKAALSMLTKGAALELAPQHIRVNTLAPGLTATDINRDQWQGNAELWQQRVATVPLGRAGTPADHAGAAVFLASDESLWMTGSCITVDGGRTVN